MDEMGVEIGGAGVRVGAGAGVGVGVGEVFVVGVGEVVAGEPLRGVAGVATLGCLG